MYIIEQSSQWFIEMVDDTLMVMPETERYISIMQIGTRLVHRFDIFSYSRFVNIKYKDSCDEAPLASWRNISDSWYSIFYMNFFFLLEPTMSVGSFSYCESFRKTSKIQILITTGCKLHQILSTCSIENYESLKDG